MWAPRSRGNPLEDDESSDWHKNEPLANSSFIGEGGLDFRKRAATARSPENRKRTAETMLIGPRAGFKRWGRSQQLLSCRLFYPTIGDNGNIMFEYVEQSRTDAAVTLSPGMRRCEFVVAVLAIAIIWAFFVWGERPAASGMTPLSVLQGCILLSVPYVALLIAALISADWTSSLLSASVALLAAIYFPFLAFVSWFTTSRGGPMLLLTPTCAALFAPAIQAIRGSSSKGKFLIWTAVLVLLLGFCFWSGVQVYLGQKYIYIPCHPNVPCHLRF